MNYEQKYNKLVNAVKILKETNPSDEGIQNWVNENVPELREGRDEEIRKALINVFATHKDYEMFFGVSVKDIHAWLERQDKQRANLINIDAMVLKYSNTREKETNSLPVNCQIRSYRQGINDALNLSLNIEKQGEQNPAWSEEDDRTLGYLLAVLEDGIPTDSGKMEKIVDWLKSLKKRYTWKPSDEQIKAIRLARSFVTDDFGDNPTLSEILIELEKQLNKIKDKL